MWACFDQCWICVGYLGYMFNVGYYFTTSNKQNAWGTQFAVTHQEIIFDPGNYFWIYSLNLSWELKFK